MSYKFGSLGHTDPDVRKRALEHNRAVIDLGVQLGSTALTVWLADGTNHPGQANFRRQFERVRRRPARAARLAAGRLAAATSSTSPTSRRSTRASTPTGARRCSSPRHAGERTRCLVDLGHHLPNANIEQVVSRLAMVGRLGGFHFNDSKYGDDDLTVGSIHPYQFFLIVLRARRRTAAARCPPCAT